MFISYSCPGATEEAKTDYSGKNPGEVTDNILKLTPLDVRPFQLIVICKLASYKFAASTPRFICIKIDKGI